MKRNDFEALSTDELWALHEQIATRLAAALTAEKRVLENRLRQLQRGSEFGTLGHRLDAGRIQLLYRNSGIPIGRQKPGLDEASGRAGSLPS